MTCHSSSTVGDSIQLEASKAGQITVRAAWTRRRLDGPLNARKFKGEEKAGLGGLFI